jgi:hypothetical protein
VRYVAYLEEEPGLDAYRLDYAPRADLAPVFICPFIAVTGTSGAIYNSMRGVQATDKGSVMNMGTYRLSGLLDEQCPMLFPWSDAPVSEPYRIVEDRDAVSYGSDHFRLDFGVRDYRWTDAGGRLDVRARRLGQVCTFWVPEQPGYDHPQMLRSHLGVATGEIDGDEVHGLFMLDYIYSHPGAMWTEIGMLTKLHNLWLNWLVEYEDGGYEGGYAWRGRPGTGFAAAHHFVDGVSTARTDAQIQTHHTERGTVERVTLGLGDLTVELEQAGSLDWPLHTCGTVSAISTGRKVKRSWNYTEYFPVNWSAVADYQAAYRALYGKHPSFQKLMTGARVDDTHRLVFDAR